MNDYLREWIPLTLATMSGAEPTLMERFESAVVKAESNVVDFREAADFYNMGEPGFAQEKLHSVLDYLNAEYHEANFKYYHRRAPEKWDALDRKHAISAARYLIQGLLEKEFGEEFEQ